MILDFDLAWPGGGPGEGVSGSRSRPWNGPLRHRGPPCACELIWAQAGTVGRLLLLLVGRSRAPSCWRIRGLVHTPIKGRVASRKSCRPRGRRIIYRERQGCRVRQLDNGVMSQVFGRKWSVYILPLQAWYSGTPEQAASYSASHQSSMLPSATLFSATCTLRKRPDQSRETPSQPARPGQHRNSRARARRGISLLFSLSTLVLPFAYIQCASCRIRGSITCRRSCRHSQRLCCLR